MGPTEAELTEFHARVHREPETAIEWIKDRTGGKGPGCAMFTCLAAIIIVEICRKKTRNMREWRAFMEKCGINYIYTGKDRL